MRLLLTALLCWPFALCFLPAQSMLDQPVSISFAHQPLEQALYKLMDETDASLLFNNRILPQKDIHFTFTQAPLSQVLDVLLADTNLDYADQAGWIVIRLKPPSPVQQEYVVSGYIEEEESGERLAEATIYEPGSQRGVHSNEYGFFSLRIPEQASMLEISYLGYRSEVLEVKGLQQDTQLLITLKPDLTLNEVVVTAADSSLLRRMRSFSADELSPGQGASLPRLAGEFDLMRMVHLLPGVQTGADGVGGIFVRGGDAGHNLVLVDGVPIYNVNHAGGLLSVFNTQTVKSVRLLKGAFPARYGGRLSSVLDVRTRDGNKEYWEGQASVGLISSNVTLEGPVVRGQSSVLLSGRGSLLNLYLQPLMRNFKADLGEAGSTSYGFFDVTAKFSHTFSDQDKLYFSFYQGSDTYDNYGSRDQLFSLDAGTGEQLGFRQKSTYRDRMTWGNQAWSLRWNHLISPELFLNTTLTHSKMNVDLRYEDRDTLQLLRPGASLYIDGLVGAYHSSIRDAGALFDFHWLPDHRHQIRFGAHLKRGRLEPGILRYNEEAADREFATQMQRRSYVTQETNFYAENTQEVSPALLLNYGLYLAHFRSGRQTYWSLQPRLSANWVLNDRWMLRSSFGKNTQFIHLLSNNTLGLPTDLWVPSTPDIAPQQAWQATLGADVSFGKGWSMSVEGYYKAMDELLNFTEGVTFASNWEHNVTQGSGTAYGIDVMLRKQRGRTQGWLSYSLAWSNRQFGRINFGEVYPFTYDRRHDVKLVVLQELGNRWDVSASWVFGTGLAFSLPQEQFAVTFPGVPGLPVDGIAYGDKNGFRLPYYHRLDVGVNYRFFGKNGLEHRLKGGVYNVYNRRNPLYYRFDNSLVVTDNQLQERKEFVGVHLLPVLPSVSYSLHF